MTGQLHINFEQDVGLNQNGSLIIGNKAGENIGIDSNEIMARNNSVASTLYLNNEGGIVQMGSGGLMANGPIRTSVKNGLRFFGGNGTTKSMLIRNDGNDF